MLERRFRLSENGTDARTEAIAGVTTFLTMAYILFVNPDILAEAGMDRGAVFVATAIASAFGTLVMGLFANYPIALAPGLGLNAFFAYTVVGTMGFSWQAALGAVFLSGLLFTTLSVLRIREAIVNAIPRTLTRAISAGIGLFLGLIALQNAGIVVDHPTTLVTVGDLRRPEPLLAALGFAVMIGLARREIAGAVLLGMALVTVIGLPLGLAEFTGIASLPPSLGPTFFALDLSTALDLGLITVVFTFLFVDLFDTTGTLVGVSHRAGLLAADGSLPRLNRALLADSSATVVGATLGTSTVTSYIESAAGTNAGGRTGLTAVVVAGLFLGSLFLAPLAGLVPRYATAAALFFVACLMSRGLAELAWDDVTEYAPGVLAAIAMPLTYSIATGIGFGFIGYVSAKALAGRWREIRPGTLAVSLLFVVKFAIG